MNLCNKRIKQFLRDSARGLWLISAMLLFAFPISSLGARSPSYADLWWNPTESGWGISLAQQDRTLFATLYIYGSDRRPYWVVGILSASTQSSKTFAGSLFETRGVPFTAAQFDPAQVASTEIGTIQITFADENSGLLQYTIRGQSVSKWIARQTLVAAPIAGSYKGYSDDLLVTYNAGTLVVDHQMPFGQRCIYTGAANQFGSNVAANGTYRCSDLTDGSWASADFSLVDQVLLTGTIVRQPASAQAAVEIPIRMLSIPARRDRPLYADLWWNPSESGWGVSFAQQDSTLFATLYIYGSDRSPYWVVAILARAESGTAFTGTVYETSGPPYDQAAFDSSTVVTKAVGSATVSFVDRVSGTLSYSINGNTYTKSIVRQTLVRLPIDGEYIGWMSGGPFGPDHTEFKITTSGDNVVLEREGFFNSTKCRFIGKSTQFGTRIVMSGTHVCGLGVEGTWLIDDFVMVNHRSFLATLFIGTSDLPAQRQGNSTLMHGARPQ